MNKPITFSLGILMTSLLGPSVCLAQVWHLNLGARNVEVQAVVVSPYEEPADFWIYADDTRVAMLKCRPLQSETQSRVCSDPNEAEPTGPTDIAYFYNLLFSVDGVEYLCKTSGAIQPVCESRVTGSDYWEPVGSWLN